MANRLLRYEWALFQNSFADAFARKRDRLLLLLVVIFALFWLRDRLGSLALPPASPRAFWLTALSLLPAFAWHRQLMARIAWLIEHSAVAPAAMERLSQRAYILVAHAFVSVPLLIGATVLYSAAGWALALLAYAAGVGVAAYIPLRRRRLYPHPHHPPRPAAAPRRVGCGGRRPHASRAPAPPDAGLHASWPGGLADRHGELCVHRRCDLA